MTREEVAKAAIQAVGAFLDRESDLVETGVNERSLTHKLAEHLQRTFSGWHVDCEYNRLGYKVKRLPYPETTSTDDTEGRTIFPDIIVHKRRTIENLLVIEVKKTTNQLPGDEDKLCGLTAPDGEYAYTLGLHLVIDCEKGTISRATAFAEGSVNDDITAVVRRALDSQDDSGRSKRRRA